MLEFDEDYYLQNNPDVAEAVRKGEWPSGLTHFCVSGKAKGRKAAPSVDVNWYLSAYPQAALEIASGKVASVRDHYHSLGKQRGYLPSPRARRATNPAAFRSRYGGLWTDVGNALDIIAGRLELGLINAEQAVLLKSWVNEGYVILRHAVPDAIIDGAQADIERAYRNDFPGLRFDVQGASARTPPSLETPTPAAAALDLHWFSDAIRRAIFTHEVLEFLHLIFERRVLASQTLAFRQIPPRQSRQDSAYLGFSLPMQFAGSYIALEDIMESAGHPACYTGSHRLAEYRYRNAFKSAAEARRVHPTIDLTAEHQRHLELIQKQSQGVGLSIDRVLARRGDALIWGPDLAWESPAIGESQSRKCIVTHYCPAELIPDYFEATTDRQIRSFAGNAFYSSQHYS
jgi:hypothetical protein